MELVEIDTSVTTVFRITDDIPRRTRDHSTVPGHYIRPDVIQVTLETTTSRTHVTIRGRRVDNTTGMVTQEPGYTTYALTDWNDVRQLGDDLAVEAVMAVVEKAQS